MEAEKFGMNEQIAVAVLSVMIGFSSAGLLARVYSTADLK
jgi:hypothetical protein